MARVARLYYNEGVRQPAIADRLGLSQARVSRLLKRALETGVVRITVLPAPGVNADLEDELQRRFGLSVAVVVDVAEDEELLRCLGAAAAYYLETSLRSGDLVGMSSRSATLLATIEQMRPVLARPGIRVVQILGGIGDPEATAHANRLTEQFAERVRGEAVFLASPAVAGSAASAQALRADRFVAATMTLYDQLDVAVVGVGALDSDSVHARSGDVMSVGELEELRRLGAVGDVCLRFFDAEGAAVATGLSERVVGIELEQLARTRRCVCVAGGAAKRDALLGALRGGFLDVLVTDQVTASLLVDAGRPASGPPSPGGRHEAPRVPAGR